jgi:DNA-binding response OmpR family regulator
VDTVLVADDDAPIAEVIAVFLREEGLDALTAGYGPEAHRIACTKRPRLVPAEVSRSR